MERPAEGTRRRPNASVVDAACVVRTRIADPWLDSGLLRNHMRNPSIDMGMRPTNAPMLLLAAVPLLALLASGCSKSDDSASQGASSAKIAAANQATSTAETLASLQVQPQPRKIIYKAEVTLDCENLDKASAKLISLVKSMGGYVGDAMTSGTRGEVREGTWTVRVPAERYDEFIHSLSDVAEFQSSSQKAEDVSEEFYDAKARLKNKQVEEARLIDLLQHRSGHLSDVLTLEKELSRVREEIERIEGRLQFLANQSDLSTVTVTLREVKEFLPKGTPSLGTRVGRSFTGSLGGMRDLGEGALVVGAALLPWLAVPLVALALVWQASKWRKKDKPNPV